MIAMQYSIVLPADYDMSIIDRRIAERGHLTDGFPGLAFKAYLQARKEGSYPSNRDNVYAPFYLWNSPDGMNDFLCGPGFAGLAQSFGWPSVKTWSVWHAEASPGLADARFATRELAALPPHARLDELRASETEHARSKVTVQGALAALCGFEPTTWTAMRFALWAEPPRELDSPDTHVYAVGHVSTGR
jgi:hypothetical protein